MYKKSAHKIWVKLTPRTCIVAIIPSFFWRQHFFLKWWQILLCRHVCGNFCQNVGHRCCRQLLNDSYLEKDRRTVYKNRFDMKYFRIQWLIIIAKNLFFGSFRTRVHGSNPTWSDILVTKTKKTSRFYYDNNKKYASLISVILNRGPRNTWCQFHQHLKPSFFVHRSQKCKMTDDLTVIFALLGSKRVKALGKMLMKLTLGCR